LEISNKITQFQFLANCVQIGEAFEILGDEQNRNVYAINHSGKLDALKKERAEKRNRGE
jgi:hypothetical protein